LLTVTEQAVARIRQVVNEHSGALAGLRVGLQDGGCSGYTYLLDFEASPDEDDMVIEKDGVKVFVHPLHLPFIAGSVLTWTEEEFRSGFILDNPNVKRLCGCGESFDV
jgi:iron-sulfur cluster assembly accessory protein